MKGVACVVLMLLVALGHAQIIEWIHRYNGPDNSSEWPYDIAVDNAGNVYVGGFGYLDSTYMDYLTIKYNSDGDTLWTRYYDGGLLFYDRIHAIAVDDSGNVFVTGLSIESGNQYDIATIKYNSDGVEQWVARYDGPGNDDDEGNDIAIDDSGYIYVCGYTRSAASYTDYITIKYDRYGDTVWTSRFNGPYNGLDIAYALALDDSGNVYVTGDGNSTTYDNDFYTIKINAAGDTQWVVAYDGPVDFAYDYASDIAIGGGYIYVTGISDGGASEEDYATVKYSPAGDTLWEMRYNGPGNAFDSAAAVVVDSLGNAYVTGSSMGTTTLRDYATIKYNFSGNIEWVSRYDGPDSEYDEAHCMVRDNFGNIFVSGRSYATQPGTPEYDFLTIKYNPEGVEQWTHRYNGTGDANDLVVAMTVDDMGNMYATGRSLGNVGYDDFVTIKYGVTGIVEDAGYTIHDAGYNLTAQPNPFSNMTDIRYQITDNCKRCELKVYDITGRLVADLSEQITVIGYQSSVRWDGRDERGRELGSGVYFIQLDAGDHQETQQVLLIR